jgi:hypothetical protein
MTRQVIQLMSVYMPIINNLISWEIKTKIWEIKTKIWEIKTKIWGYNLQKSNNKFDNKNKKMLK